MERIPLIGGAYSARWAGAASGQCVNYYPELNPPDSPVPVTHYQRGGLKALSVAAVVGPVRLLYRASNGKGYAVVGSKVYYIQPGDFSLTLLGSLTATNRTNPCSMIDNGVTALLVDGSPQGYTIVLATNTFAAYVDSTGLFQGGDRVDVIDTFVLCNVPGTTLFISTLSNTLTLDPTYIAGKVGYPDPLISLIVNRHQILLLGALKSEIWYNAGNPLFPFAQLPGTYVEHGLAATYSVASSDVSVFWLHQDLQGQGMVLRQKGYETKRVSNHALEDAIRRIAASSSISDAIGWTYQQDGHLFYVLTFPSGNQTWVFDDAMVNPVLAWHQEAFTNSDGVLERHRGNCGAFIYGKNLVGDHTNGTIYEVDLDYYSDLTIDGVKHPMSCIRTFPHLTKGKMLGQIAESGGQVMTFNKFWLDLQVGAAPQVLGSFPPQVSLRWSNDKGVSFGNAILQSAGRLGEYVTQPQWTTLGLARDMVFEVSHSLDGPAAINGAWYDADINPQA